MLPPGTSSCEPARRPPKTDRSIPFMVMVDAMPRQHQHAPTTARERSQARIGIPPSPTLVREGGGLASHVHPLVSPATPVYRVVAMVEFIVLLDVAKRPELTETVRFIFVLPWPVFAKAQTLLAEVHCEWRIRTYALLPPPCH
uniref:Bifunctional solanapyrone synthase (Prosolanapyrone-II oxidase) (Prosolanapyrone-III cycloisomerase) (Solanapyrone biosynthesis protein 5))) n=1 Tax=Ganoderma boninense TaxID=34458 RepID=A0A5K1JUD7_9APHY|nr:Bifunctional solanapyrone synthase (EC (EC (FAD-dependent monooxygenase sol5) (Prosolanapyrone-II oxidase) (Prosolanapyrone-III cycloisomerase) (Solanapyrone biosynthesis protein 5) [Ganoderma boninense]